MIMVSSQVCFIKISFMQYRYLGPTGIKVSVIGFGNWVNSNSEKEKLNTINCVKVAYDHGVNFFDTAEIYGFGQAEKQMGEALHLLNVPRESYVLSTKLWKATMVLKPNRQGLSRKHLIQGMKKSLKNLKHDYVDVVFAHRPDYYTPMEETCKAFDWIVRKGMAHYWGTSQWNAEDIREAYGICERLGLIKPVVEQPQYNPIVRTKFEIEYKRLFEKTKMGTTIWSPLCGGLLTGKYSSGQLKQGRYASSDPMFQRIFNQFGGNTQATFKKLRAFDQIAKSIQATPAQLAMAWCLYNKDVSVAITGASKPQQLIDTFKAVDILKKYTPEIDGKIEDIFGNLPTGGFDRSTFQPEKSRRLHYSGYVPK